MRNLIEETNASVLSLLESNEKFIIVNKYGLYWTGQKWHDEYPQAHIYTTQEDALKDAKKVKGAVLRDAPSPQQKDGSVDLDALRNEELKFFKEIAMRAQALKDLADKYNTWQIKNDLQELVNHQSQKLESQARSNLERVLQII